MNGTQIVQKIFFGYAKAAQHLGLPFQLYRSAMPLNPIQPANLIGTLPCNATQQWSYMTSNRPGNAIWYLLIDAQDVSAPLNAQEGDYIVGYETFYIFSLEPDLPPQGVQCNRTISIIRPTQSVGPGLQPYGAYTPATSTTIMSLMPASVLLLGRGNASDLKLPTDAKQPSWRIMVPNIGHVNVEVGDFIIDDVNQFYVVNDNEETEFGWRLTATQVVNSG